MRVFVACSSLFTTLPQSAVFTQTKQLFMSTLGVFFFTFTLSHRKRSSTSSNFSNFQSCLLQRIDCYLGTAMRSSGMEEKGRWDETSIKAIFVNSLRSSFNHDDAPPLSYQSHCSLCNMQTNILSNSMRQLSYGGAYPCLKMSLFNSPIELVERVDTYW